MSIAARINRLFAEDGKCFDVAVDHGIFNEPGFLRGIENIGRAVETIAGAKPDAIQLAPGQARFLQDIPGKSKPALVMRTDVTNSYGNPLPSHLFTQLIEDPVKKAVTLDAACVVVNLLLLPGQHELHHDSVRNVARLRKQCDEYGMPLMVEPLVMLPNEIKGGYMVDGDIRKIIPLVRQAVELGADVIKADPCDRLEEYGQVVEAASGKPLLVRGGGAQSEEEIISKTWTLMREGVKGIVYGRNIIQHPKPQGITKAFMSIVHENASVECALNLLRDSTH